MTRIDAKEAASALNDIEQIVQRVRQSRTCDIASLRAGVRWQHRELRLAALRRRHGVNAVGAVGSIGVNVFQIPRTAGRSFDIRMTIAFVLFFAFGLLCSTVLGHFGPREMGAFWPIYFMLIYCIAGLWFGYAFVAIGLGITVLTLIGYFFVGGFAFLLWMAAVNGGGLVLGGLWMRRS
jgi:hypothetical protein